MSVCYARVFDEHEPTRKLKDIDGLFNGPTSIAKAIRSQGGALATITLDGYAASHRAVCEMKAPQSSKYLNNLIEVRHEVAYRSCSHFSPHRRREPPVSPGESRSLNQERL